MEEAVFEDLDLASIALLSLSNSFLVSLRASISSSSRLISASRLAMSSSADASIVIALVEALGAGCEERERSLAMTQIYVNCGSTVLDVLFLRDLQ